MPGRTAVVALSDNSRVDLDWILPLLDELSEMGTNVEVFDFTPVDRGDRDSYGMRALYHVLGRRPRCYADLEPIPRAIARWLDRLRASRMVAVSRIGALYFSSRSPLQRIFPLSAWRSKARAAALRALFVDCAALFVGLRAEEWRDGTGEAELIAAARAHGVPVIGYPPVVDHEIPHRRLMTCDLALANTRQQAQSWKSVSTARVVPVTPPAFTRRWLRRIKDIQLNLIGEDEIVDDGKRVLVILKNDNSIVWTGLDFHETASEMIAVLLDAGMHLLIKPHPRQSAAALQRLLEPIDPARYTLVDGPLAYWAQHAHYVVSLFSGGVLDCLAAGRVAILFWPMTETYRANIASGDVTDVYVRLGPDGTITTKYRPFCIEVTSPKFRLPEAMDEESCMRAFRRHYPEAEDCRAIHDAIAALHALDSRPCRTSMA